MRLVDLRHTPRLPLVLIRLLLPVHFLRRKVEATLGFGQGEIDVIFHVYVLACIGRNFNAVLIGAVLEIEVPVRRCNIFGTQFSIRLQLRIELGIYLTVFLGLVRSVCKFRALLVNQEFLQVRRVAFQILVVLA